MDVGYRKEIDKFCFFSDGRTAICGRHDIKPFAVWKSRAVSPVAIAVLTVFGKFPKINGGCWLCAGRDRPLGCRLHIGGNRVAC